MIKEYREGSESQFESNTDAEYKSQLVILTDAVSRWTTDSELLGQFRESEAKGDFSGLFEYIESPQSETLFQERFEIQSDLDMLIMINEQAMEQGQPVVPVQEMAVILWRNHLERMEQASKQAPKKQIENKQPKNRLEGI